MSSRNLKYTLVVDNGDSTLTAFKRGESQQYGPANETHPMWDKLVAGVLADDVSVLDLFNPLIAIGKRMSLSERIAIANGRLFFDGDEVEDTLTRHIADTLAAGGDVTAHVQLLENIKTNPSVDSQTQLYRFLTRHKFTITHDGLIVGYKAVNVKMDSKGTEFASKHAGPAIINGVPHASGHVPQKVGDIITMPRSEVDSDAHSPCSHGLHVGNWAYVQSQYRGSTVLEVHFNPRDVVSVPVDSSDGKVRVCRYKVIRAVREPYSVPVLPAPREIKAPHGVVINKDGTKTPMTNVTGEVRIAPIAHPRIADFEQLQARAKNARKGLVGYIHRHTDWKLIPGREGKDRKDWAR